MGSTRQGFYWWEFDATYYPLKALSYTGLIWNLKPVPASVYEEARALRAALNRTGDLFLHDLEDLGTSYARTLHVW